MMVVSVGNTVSVAPEYASLITAMRSKTVLQLTGAVEHATSLSRSLLLKALLLTSSPLSTIHLLLSLSTSRPTYLQLTLSKILLSMSHPLSNRPPERITRPAQHLKSPLRSSATPLQKGKPNWLIAGDTATVLNVVEPLPLTGCAPKDPR